MNKTIISIFLFATLVSCNSAKVEEERTRNKLDEAVEMAKNAKDSIQNIFLDFKFGMTEKEVNKHLKQLQKENKIYIAEDYSYQYDFNTEYGFVLKTTFSPRYYNGKLYKMIYSLNGVGGSPAAASTFLKTNPDGFKRFFVKDVLGDPEYVFVNGNLIIRFAEPSQMVYVNAPVLKLVEAEEDSLDQENLNKTISDFK